MKKKLLIGLVLGAVLLTPATAQGCEWLLRLFTPFQYEEPVKTPWKTEVKKAVVVPASPTWRDFKPAPKPVHHKVEESKWSKWKFWDTKSRGTEGEPKKEPTDERTTTEPVD